MKHLDAVWARLHGGDPLYSTIRFANGTNNSCRTALADLELQLEALGLITPSPERPSERAMRLASQTKEWKQTDYVI